MDSNERINTEKSIDNKRLKDEPKNDFNTINSNMKSNKNEAKSNSDVTQINFNKKPFDQNQKINKDKEIKIEPEINPNSNINNSKLKSPEVDKKDNSNSNSNYSKLKSPEEDEQDNFVDISFSPINAENNRHFNFKKEISEQKLKIKRQEQEEAQNKDIISFGQ